MNEIKVFCPATVANISCGFDVLGLCLESVGDEMTVRKIKDRIIRINKITGQELPLQPEKNVAGVAALSLLKQLHVPFGFEIEISKRIKPGSGIGSSAASAAGAVYAINKLAGSPLNSTELVYHAMQGEVLASGSAHADNVAPAILGGFTLVRGYDPLDIIKIPSPEELTVVVIHPQIEIKTSEARALLSDSVSLKNAITQWGNLGGLISGLYSNDYDLISRSLVDVIAEPARSNLIPKFNAVKEASINAGALGSGISGSGPSIFALCKGMKIAKKVETEIKLVYDAINLPYETHVSTINTAGVKTLTTQK
ncbi:homoserine kinase [Ascidiimonas sp. W6]|uniref:homoserine kinase n=1 Tax=Ascidiimonas meishanensis TaxID=3128903 RepID=UPI0030EBCA41